MVGELCLRQAIRFPLAALEETLEFELVASFTRPGHARRRFATGH